MLPYGLRSVFLIGNVVVTLSCLNDHAPSIEHEQFHLYLPSASASLLLHISLSSRCEGINS